MTNSCVTGHPAAPGTTQELAKPSVILTQNHKWDSVSVLSLEKVPLLSRRYWILVMFYFCLAASKCPTLSGLIACMAFFPNGSTIAFTEILFQPCLRRVQRVSQKVDFTGSLWPMEHAEEKVWCLRLASNRTGAHHEQRRASGKHWRSSSTSKAASCGSNEL